MVKNLPASYYQKKKEKKKKNNKQWLQVPRKVLKFFGRTKNKNAKIWS